MASRNETRDDAHFDQGAIAALKPGVTVIPHARIKQASTLLWPSVHSRAGLFRHTQSIVSTDGVSSSLWLSSPFWQVSANFVRQLAGRNPVGLVDVVVGGNKMVWTVGRFSRSPSCSGALPTPLFRRFWLTFIYSIYHCVVVVVNRPLFQPISVLSLGCASPLYEVRRAFKCRYEPRPVFEEANGRTSASLRGRQDGRWCDGSNVRMLRYIHRHDRRPSIASSFRRRLSS